jgi:hypothetical protein
MAPGSRSHLTVILDEFRVEPGGGSTISAKAADRKVVEKRNKTGKKKDLMEYDAIFFIFASLLSKFNGSKSAGCATRSTTNQGAHIGKWLLRFRYNKYCLFVFSG